MSGRREVDKARSDIEQSAPTYAAEPIRRYLRLVRELRLRESEDVVTYGAYLLQKHRRQLGQDEEWTVVEQITFAALDTKSLDYACMLVAQVKKQFPGTQRAERLTAAYFEAKQMWDHEEKVLEKLTEDHPDSQAAMRRMIACEKTRGNTSRALELLQKYVDTFMTDREAWEELGDMYLQVQMYPQAAHCYEELLMHQPHSIPLYVQYADIMYTMGGSNFRTARSYYAAAIKLSEGKNLRALYGLTATTAQLAGIKGSQGRSSKEDDELAELAAETLVRLYREQAPAKLPLVQELLKSQGLPARA